MERVFPDKRAKGHVLIEHIGYSISSTAKRIWPKALLSPRKPIYFSSYDEAVKYRDEIRVETVKPKFDRTEP